MPTNRLEAFSDGVFAIAIVFIPFPTALIAEHLESGADEEVAAAIYSGAFLAMALSYGFLWTYITRHRELLGVELSDEQIRRTSRAFLIGNPFYALAFAMSFIGPAVVLVINGLLAIYYAVAGMRSPLARSG